MIVSDKTWQQWNDQNLRLSVSEAAKESVHYTAKWHVDKKQQKNHSADGQKLFFLI